MIRIFLLRCWPALIPIGIYLGWYWLARRRAKKAGEPIPHLLDGPWLWTAFFSVLFLAAALFIIPLTAEQNSGTSYHPKALIDGKLQSESIE
ncbi:MAG: hypothetical protein MRY32_00760 [Rickettsiales bacterium]|nr:hypothetical protein [Rickettsiales bacterium]